MRARELWVAFLVLAPAAALAAAPILTGGKEAVVQVKKKPVSYVTAAEGSWQVQVNGPGDVTIALRWVIATKKPTATVLASLDGAGEMRLALTGKADGSAKLKAGRRDKLSQEVAVTYRVPTGAHVLAFRLAEPGLAGYLRVLEVAPANALAGGVFAEPAPPRPPPAVAPPPMVAAVAPPPASKTGAAPASSPMPAGEAAATALAGTQPGAPSSSAAEEIIAAAPSSGEAAIDASALGVGTSEAPVAADRASPKLLGIVAGGQLGLGFPQVLTKLGLGTTVGLEAGYLLPPLDQRIEVYLDGWYSQALRRSTATDERLAAGDTFHFTIIEQQVLVHVGGLYRVFPPRTFLNFYGRVAGRLELQRSVVKGKVEGLGMGKNNETKTAFGASLGGGAELTVGPGALVADLGFAFADLSHRVTGDTSSGGLSLAVGYRLIF